MNVKLAVLADFASITREGKVNILGIFDQMQAARLPAGVPIFYIVVVYEAGPAEAGQEKDTAIVLTDEDGAPKARIEQKVKVEAPPFPGSRRTINQVNGISGLRFEKAGVYQFAILVNGQEEGTISLRVHPPKEATDVTSS